MKCKYTTIGNLRELGKEVQLGDEPLDNEIEVRLIPVATTKEGEILVQADIKDSYGTWDSHFDSDILLGLPEREYTDISTGEPFESYSGYGLLLAKEQFESL